MTDKDHVALHSTILTKPLICIVSFLHSCLFSVPAAVALGSCSVACSPTRPRHNSQAGCL